MKTLILKYRIILIIGICFVVLTSAFHFVVEKRVSNFNGYTIVLDAGHGGRDGGSVGVNGTIEKEINLEYVLLLKDKLVENGFKVVLTRKNNDGLYSEIAKNKKQSDMNARFKIIENANPNLVISLHMNSFQNSTARGAMTYFRRGDASGQACANLIQKSLAKNCDARFSTSKVGDYFMLNCSYYTAVLIECGFISNPEEEKLLNSKEYKNLMVDAIFKGILLYFGINHI